MKKIITFIVSLSFVFSFTPMLANAATTTNKPTAKSAIASKTIKQKSKVISVNMTVKDFEFDPSVISAHQGDTIKITITGADATHSFSAPALHENVKVEPGQTKTFSFKVTKKGTFTFKCGVPCGSGHRDMKGTIIVS